MKAYRLIALVIAAGVLLQAAFIAYAWFDVLNTVDGGIPYSADSEGNAGHMGHGMVGVMVMPLLGLVLLITSFFTKTVGATKRAGMVFGAIVLQVLLGFVSFEVPVMGFLHGLNAFVVLGAALYASRLTALPATLSAPRESSAV